MPQTLTAPLPARMTEKRSASSPRTRLVESPASLRELTIVSQYYYPEEAATAELLFDLSLALRKRGFRVRAVTAPPSYHHSRRRLRSDSPSGIPILRLPAACLDKNTTWGRVLNTMSFTLSFFLWAVFSRSRAPLLIVTCPPQALWVGAVANALRGRPFVILVHDLYPEIAEALGKLKTGSLVARLWRRLNRFAFRRAAAVIVPGRCVRRSVARYLPPKERSKIAVIPSWSAGDDVRPLPRKGNPLLSALGLDRAFVVQYSGNIGLFHEIETVLAAAERLARLGGPTSSRVRFLFVGTGAQRPLVERAARTLPNVTLLPFQPRRFLPISLAACDLALVTLKTGAEGLSVPSKTYRILAAGRPVLAVMNPDAEVARLVLHTRCGAVSPPGDPAALARLILELAESPDRLAAFAAVARRAYEEEFTTARIASLYARLLARVLPSSRP
ncbi:MAG: glycosyltransferase family 4 protein [Planctomycetota bacterium]